MMCERMIHIATVMFRTWTDCHEWVLENWSRLSVFCGIVGYVVPCFIGLRAGDDGAMLGAIFGAMLGFTFGPFIPLVVLYGLPLVGLAWLLYWLVSLVA